MAQQVLFHISDYNQVYDYALKHQRSPAMLFLVGQLRRSTYVKNGAVDASPKLDLPDALVPLRKTRNPVMGLSKNLN